MALSEFYCQSGGSNLNAGSTTSNAASLTYASGNWVAGTGVFTVASGNPSSDGVAVGDFASVYADGSTTTGFVGRVTARDATTITVSLTAKAGTAPTDGTGNRTLKIGGAWQGPNASDKFPFEWMQSTLTNAAGNKPRVNFKNSASFAIGVAISHNPTSGGNIIWSGMTTTPGDGGLAIFTDASVELSFTFGSNCADTRLEYLDFRNQAGSGSGDTVTMNNARAYVFRCVFRGSRRKGLYITGSSSQVISCEAYDCNKGNSASTGGFHSDSSTYFDHCIAHHNTGSNTRGFYTQGSACQFVRCIAAENGLDGYGGGNNAHIFTACDAYFNGGDGFDTGAISGGNRSVFISCNASRNGGYGFNIASGAAAHCLMRNCGGYGNTSGFTNMGGGHLDESGTPTYAANTDPWTDPANGNFKVALAAAKGTGYSGFLITQSYSGSTTGYPDIGAAHHQDSGGSSFAMVLEG